MPQRKRILVVDDSEVSRLALKTILENLGHDSEIATDGIDATAKMSLDIDLVLLDIMMPGMDGFEVARRIREDPEAGDVPIIMVTGSTSLSDRIRAVEAGANDFIAKPIDLTELRVRTASLLRMKEAQDSLKRHHRELEQTIQKQTASLRQALEEMAEAQQRTYEAHADTIRRLAVAAEYKDEGTASHIHRMARYCTLLARGLGFAPGEVEIVAIASPMHDVGKIGIPEAILLKSGKLTAAEMEVMRRHTVIGARILGGSSSALLQAGQAIALSHHEKWDGSGYPNGLAREEIPLYARVCAVADVFDALTSNRPYRRALSHAKAVEMLKAERGKHFDPQILDAFMENLAEVDTIRQENSDI